MLKRGEVLQNQFLPGEEAKSEYVLIEKELVSQETATSVCPETKSGIQEWLTKFRNAVRKSRNHARALNITASIVGILPFSMLFLPPSFALPPISEFFLYYYVSVVALYYLLYQAILLKSKLNIEEITKLANSAAVGPLLELLPLPEGKKNFPALLTLLTELLPKMKADEANDLTSEQRHNLMQTLSYGLNMTAPTEIQQNYLLAAINSLPQIGNSKSLALVSKIANNQPKTEFQIRMKAEAEMCLPLLMSRLEELKDHKTLLRSSSGANALPGTTPSSGRSHTGQVPGNPSPSARIAPLASDQHQLSIPLVKFDGDALDVSEKKRYNSQVGCPDTNPTLSRTQTLC